MIVPEPASLLASPAASRISNARYWLIALCLVLLSMTIQVPGLRHEKVIDDLMLIDSQELRGCGDDTLKGCMTGGVFKLYYRPLLSASFMWGVKLHGAEPMWHRFENLMLHTILTALVFGFFRLLFRQDHAALAVGTLFALHPLHVPVTTFIGGRTDTLSLCFLLPCAMATILMGASRTTLRLWFWLFVGMVCFFLALLSKEQSFLIIFLLPLLFRFGRDKIDETPPQFTSNKISLLSLYFIPLAVFGWLARKYTPRNTYDGADWDIALRIETIGRTLWYYVKAFVFPTVGTLHQSTAGAWDVPQYGIMALGFGAAGLWIAALVKMWGNREVRFLMLWTTLTVAPCLNLIPIPSQAVAPYRAMIPALGTCGLMGLAFAATWQNRRTQMAGVYGFVALASGYLYVSLADVPLWKNELTVMYAEIAADPNFLPAWGGAAGLLQRENKTLEAMRYYDHAEAVIFGETKDVNGRIALLDTLTLRRRIRSASSLRYRSREVVNKVLRGQGGNLQMLGRIEEAIPYYRVALAANPFDGELRDYIAMCYEYQRESAAQEAVLQEGVRLMPKALPYAKLGKFYFQTGRWVDARETLTLALSKAREDGTLSTVDHAAARLMLDQTIKITKPR